MCIRHLFYFWTLSLSWFTISSVYGQLTFPVNGVRHPDHSTFLLRNAVVHQDSHVVLSKSSLLIRDGIIVDIGPKIMVGDSVQVLDMEGKHLYPAFIELYSSFGMPEKKKTIEENSYLSNREGAFGWNEALRTDYMASAVFRYQEEAASKWRNAGFAMLQTHVPDGISRGSACVTLLKPQSENEILVTTASSHVLSFNKGSSSQYYPSSLMGSIALLRQTYLDGTHYQSAIRPSEVNLSLENWNQLQKLPQLFVAGSSLNVLRAAAIAKEFKTSYLLFGDGREYQWAEEIKQTGMPCIIPVQFPAPFEIKDPMDVLQIDLSDLKHWELAPANAGILAKQGISFMFTSDGLQDPKEFLTNVRKAVKYGLSEAVALHAMTAGPAGWLGLLPQTGTIHRGKWANIIVTDGPLFEENTQILETWVKGTSYRIIGEPEDQVLAGNYEILLDTQVIRFSIQKIDHKWQIKAKVADTNAIRVRLENEGRYLHGSLNREQKGSVLISAWMTNDTLWNGKALMEDGRWQEILIRKTEEQADTVQSKNNNPKLTTDSLGALVHPFMAYGWQHPPRMQKYLIKNATVWTNEPDGIKKNCDVLVDGGKILEVGSNLSGTGATIIDGTGKHLTPGIIDEHSHIAIQGGVNECSHSVTAEVRIGDVVNSEDINVYRQLAGGVTMAQLLHGSCNPVGGQSALIKMRWGYSPEKMKVSGADPFIKFALGENVKRSGGNQTNRYPDTRMGVEQIYLDAFERARQYDYNRKTKPESTRRDLQLEALAEIVNKKRFITCHSYVQSEINMLMKVAERFGFRVNTFTHILEGYKVADIMKRHGAGAAGFSDWWAYKYEVYEAIPYNGALLHREGVVTAYNSDDAEMARRLNQEAAKAVMYGDVPEEEALKFVTLNPAKLLHVDHLVGSILKGKDADLVLWNEHPLSVKAVADITWVDGIKFYDRSENDSRQKEISKERNRILQKMLKAAENGEKPQKFGSRKRRLYHCDSEGMDDYETEEENH